MNTLQTGLQDPELADIAAADLARAEATPEVVSLAEELAAIQEARHMSPGVAFDAMRARNGDAVFIVACANGRHESKDGYAVALELLVDSFRTRLEDLPEIHERVLAIGGGSLKASRNTALSMARTIRAKNPDMPGEARDALLEADLRALEAQHEARQRRAVP